METDMPKKTWKEKLADPKPFEVKTAPKDFADIKAGQKMLLTTPRQIDEFVQGIAPGESLNMKQLRAGLAKESGADIACPVVTGISLRTVAEVVDAELLAGIKPKDVTPVWRVLTPGATALKKLDSGGERMLALRKAEGLRV